MKRLLTILLLVLFPLHASFAAAAGYCQHQQESPQAAHFGHHAHHHDGAPDQPSGGGFQIDPDCGFCHLPLSAFMPMLASVVEVGNLPQLITAVLADFRSAAVEPFDRPPRTSLA
jgi:hypothetical protein